MLETLLPGAVVLLMVLLGPEAFIGRATLVFSFGRARRVDFPLFLDTNGPGPEICLFDVGDVLPPRIVTSVCIRENEGRLSGEDRREGAFESKEETKGPGMRLAC